MGVTEGVWGVLEWRLADEWLGWCCDFTNMETREVSSGSATTKMLGSIHLSILTIVQSARNSMRMEKHLRYPSNHALFRASVNSELRL